MIPAEEEQIRETGPDGCQSLVTIPRDADFVAGIGKNVSE